MTTERIGIFGGAFDPVHSGHVEVIRTFLKSGLFHKIRVLPTASPPHKQQALTAYTHRKQMLELALSDLIDNQLVEISDLESLLPTPNYSLRTFRYLHEKSPENVFYLCLGSDSLVTIERWHKYKELLDMTVPVVASRPGWNPGKVPSWIRERSIILANKEMEVSSTDIRSRIAEHNQIETDQIPSHVEAYIRTHQLYKD